jgi:hypothetical protein
MTTFDNGFLHWVGLTCITPWAIFDSELALYLIGGEL